MATIPGEVVIQVYEASRIKNLNVFDKQYSYAKIKHAGKKARSLATDGGTAPRWTEEGHQNRLRLDVEDCINAEISVEIWNESRHKKNARIDYVVIPVEPYARSHVAPTPKWHHLASQGSVLFSVEFIPAAGAAKEAFDQLEKIVPKHAADDSTITNKISYHDDSACDNICFGDTIAIHALGERWVKFGTCFRTHLQKEKKCLQLTKKFETSASRFEIGGNDDKSVPLTYGTHFHLLDVGNDRTRVSVGTGSFIMTPVDTKKRGRGDVVQYGDAIYLQAIYAKIGTETIGCEGESMHVLDSTIYLSPHTPKVTFTLTYEDGLLKKPKNDSEEDTSIDINLTTYNVWMMPDKITKFADVSPKKCERAQLIPQSLPTSDIVIFNEAFCHQARPVLLEAMKDQGFYYESPVVGHCVGRLQAKFLDGGVVIVSRHPIILTDVMRFGGVCHGDDALADKGVVYACVVKDGRKVHVFASHTQAWADEAAIKVRQDQFRMMRNFIDEQCIPASEPVIVAGDFNVNSLVNASNGEYDAMLELLECRDAPPAEDQETDASFNAENNPLAADGPSSDGVNERLDFILTCRHHLEPASAYVKVNPIKANESWTWGKKGEFKDLSDHYPVTSGFKFKY